MTWRKVWTTRSKYEGEFLTRTEWQDELRASFVDDMCWIAHLTE